VNALLVLLVMVAIYGWFAIFDPRAARSDGRAWAVGSWLVASTLAVGVLFLDTGLTPDIRDPTSDDLAAFLVLYLIYGFVMTLLLEEARTIRITSPTLLVTHGMALGALADSHVEWLFGIGVLVTPLVLYATLRRKVGLIVRFCSYIWCMVVFTGYAVWFVDVALVRSTDISMVVFALPFLLMRLSSYVAMLMAVFPGEYDTSSPMEGFDKLVAHTELVRLSPALVPALPVATAALMAVAIGLGQAAGGFVVLFVAGQLLALRLQPAAYPSRRWRWERA
jgi:hypothetical protein